MTLIKNFKSWLSRILIPLSAQFHETTEKELEPHVSTIPFLQDVWANYKAKVKAFLDLFKRAKKYLKTALIEQLDGSRDKLMRRVALIIETTAMAPLNEQEKAYANQLMYLLNIYKGAENRDYESNTSLITHFLDAAQSSPYAAAVAALNLTDLLAALRTLNNDFQSVYVARLKEMEENKTIGPTGEHRKAADEAFGLLCETINGMQHLHIDADTKATLDETGFITNAILDQYLITYHRHTGTASKKPGTGGGGEPTEPAEPTEPTEPAEPTEPGEPGEPGGTENPDIENPPPPPFLPDFE